MNQYKEDMTPVKYGPAKLHHHISRFKQPRLVAHWHDQMELIRLRQGEMTVGCENVVELSPGDIYIIPPKTPHYVVCCDEDAVYDVVMFDLRAYYNDTELCRDYLEPIFDGRAKFQLRINHPEITACFDTMIDPALENSFGLIPVVYQILELLQRHALAEIGTEVKGRNSITQATEYMKANLAERITTKSLARRFGYSQEHFCRVFKEVTQFTPMQYLKIFRLERAMNLLNQNKYNISEISALCGFSDPNYFTRCFREFFGVPPTRMQKNDPQDL